MQDFSTHYWKNSVWIPKTLISGDYQSLTNPEFVVADGHAIVDITLNYENELCHIICHDSQLTINASNFGYATVWVSGDSIVTVNQSQPCKIVVIKDLLKAGNPTIVINGSGSSAVFFIDFKSVYARGGSIICTEDGRDLFGSALYYAVKPLKR